MTEQQHQHFNEKTPQRRGPVQFQIEEKPPVAALLIVPITNNSQSATSSQISTVDQLEEAIGLALAIDLDLKDSLTIPLDTMRPATLLGKGKVEELKTNIETLDVELVIIDHALTPGQQRNLEREWNTKILDRTGLILEIFGRRAATKEGRLQVDLAHLNYQKSRLVRSWTHLERQRGGAGFMGGPGETQLEADKRQIQARILGLSKELERVRKTRDLHRKKRAKVPYPVIALVGYTNAGKSTLFNRLTGANVLAKDQLFATLDPTMRAIELPGGTKAILSDTVGFISNLPTQLIAAFRATLEEVLEADLILHVEDIANPNREQHRKDVLNILKELGVNEGEGRAQTPIITLWNKIDCLEREEQPTDNQPLDQQGKKPENYETGSTANTIRLSAKTGEGVDQLLEIIENHIKKEEITLDLTLTPGQGSVLSWLYQNAKVVQGITEEDGNTHYTVTLPSHLSGRLQKMLKSNHV